MRKVKGIMTALLGLGACLALSGCARSVLNYQIAESIGTLGQYENNEPVETPKMQAERERKESEAAVEEHLTSVLEEAEGMAQRYEYAQAISHLQNADISHEDERVTEAVTRYQEAMENMYEYEGEIGHLSFTNLIADPSLAFDGDGNAAVYASNMITLSEFQGILEQLYENGYVLIDLHSLVEETEESEGRTVMTRKNPLLPQGKKPLILSVDNLNYSSVINGDGVATRLTLDEQGEVQAVYTDAQGHDLAGDYDIVPVLNTFVEEHPDFSLGGAKGIISLSGTEGAFGYDLSEESSAAAEENQETVRAIAASLLEEGWQFASAGYSYTYLGDMTYEGLQQDMAQWEETIGVLIGETDILMYPYGAEVDYSTEKAVYLMDEGFRYFIGMWTEGDHFEVNEDYARQTRRMVTGYVFEQLPTNFDQYFSSSQILDEQRP